MMLNNNCEFYCDIDKKCYKQKSMCDGYNPCSFYKDCIYKQLQQLKQENESLKESVKKNKLKRKQATERYQQLKDYTNIKIKELEQEIERLKEGQTYFENKWAKAEDRIIEIEGNK